MARRQRHQHRDKTLSPRPLEQAVQFIPSSCADPWRAYRAVPDAAALLQPEEARRIPLENDRDCGPGRRSLAMGYPLPRQEVRRAVEQCVLVPTAASVPYPIG